MTTIICTVIICFTILMLACIRTNNGKDDKK